jgi:nitroimidazol reductase NimA-like FMN-containing flavoprotein (pyridoxamine 5'-phosphate oxidase superfamily)
LVRLYSQTVTRSARAVDEFLALPLVARVAANSPEGPTVRPVWFLYEDGAFWWLTAATYSRLGAWLEQDPRVALSIDTCDLSTGEVLAVYVTGIATVVPLDFDRAFRKLAKYLGDEQTRWPARFVEALNDPATKLVTLRPSRPPSLRDMSFEPPLL